jgi:hypothetical protein
MRHSSLRLSLAMWCSFASFLVASAARAEDGPRAGTVSDALPAQLAWDAPDECPSAQGVLERLTDLLGQTPAAWSRYERVSVSMQRDTRSGWLLLLTLERGDDSQQRTLSAPRCEELGNAAAVALAIALGDDEQADAAQIEWEQPAPATAPQPASERDDPARARLPEPRASAGVQIVTGAEGVLDVLALGKATFGVGVHAGVHSARFGAGLYGLLLPGRSEPVGDGVSQRVDFALLAGGVRACYRVLSGRAHADTCGAFELGSLSADARGLVAASDSRDLWLATGLGVDLGWDLTPALALSARAEGLVPLVTESYVVNESETVTTTPDVTLRAALGLAVQFQ